MIVNKISSNFATPSFKAKADENEAKKFVEGFKNLEKDFKNSKTSEIEAARKRLMNGTFTEADKEIANKYIKELDGMSASLKELGENFKKNGKPEADKVPKLVQNLYTNFSKSGLMKFLSKNGAKGVTIALAAGNIGKEIIGTLFYTMQALTNEDLPPDKRKFIGMYDLMVGAVSTGFSILFGVGAVTMQDKILTKALKKNKGPKYSKYATAYAGLTFLIPNLLQTIIGKRIIAPAIATPTAGKWKEKQLAKMEAEKAQNEQQVAVA